MFVLSCGGVEMTEVLIKSVPFQNGPISATAGLFALLDIIQVFAFELAGRYSIMIYLYQNLLVHNSV